MAGAVAKSFQVLEAVSRGGQPTRLSTLAADLRLQKSTVHRVLSELVELGYVERDDAGTYRPTLKTWEIGTAVVADIPLKQTASAALHDLHARTGETVSLVVRAGDDALYLDKIISPRPLRFTTRVGSRVPLPLPTGGRAILAHCTDAGEIVARVAAASDPALPLDVAKAIRGLERVRRDGFAMSSRPRSITSVAAPVFDRHGYPAGALSVSAPTDRLTPDGRTEVVDAVVTSANRLTESLGRR